jgi:RNA polymerase sigma factor (TIGR02999 family)
MADFRSGDSRAGGQLVELLYPELKRIAAGQMRREWNEHSWQPTLLVNELYLEVLKIKGLPPRSGDPENDKAAFLALANQVMKRLLIHHARPLSKKARQVPLEEDLPLDAGTGILEVEDLLSRLAEVKPEIRTVAELKVFHGLTAEEIAARLGCATVTVNRYWQFARRWLRKELEG